ncbi:YobI family P-loop NTPase [Pedobacter sp.]
MDHTTTEHQAQQPTTNNPAPSAAGSPLNSLSPIDDADKDGSYSKMLLWALNNREEKDIKNIALTGPYGSGKSSVLKTFEKKYASDELVFLNISLATFKEEKGEAASKLKKIGSGNTVGPHGQEDNDQNGHTTAAEKQALLRLVELSILQQIFYHEKDEDIPDTRFKKTRSFSEESAKWLTLSIFLFLTSLVYLLYSKAIWSSFNIELPESGNSMLNIMAWGIVLWMGFSFIKQSIRPLRSIQLKKFNFHDAEFAMDDNISKSILNEHLDELLYFFEVTKYTVVVFEDLDRFEQTEIFTKLRELNHLINYSKKMNNRKVAFVYAVRDDMFRDKDRTKFFDFIIPIIPVVNSTNSNEILRDIVKTNAYHIKEDLLDNISLYVDDMRLLFNIMNEYYLYQNKLDKNLDQNKLLGILIYKNIYPNDFVDLSNNKGLLYNAIHKKDGFIADRTDELNNEIEAIKNEIKRLEGVSITNATELRKLYVLGFLQQYPDANAFKLNNIDYRIEQLSEEGIFNVLIGNTNRKYGHKDYYNNNAFSDASIAFSKIEAKVDPTATYAERLAHIEDLKQGKIDELKIKINNIQNQIQSVKHTPINTLLKNDLVEIKMDDDAQQQLVSVLLRGDYINESYQDYISIFYPGSLTKTDRDFILNVKAHKRVDFDFQLNEIDQVIKKIPDFEFESNYILNYSLVDHVLTKARHAQTRTKIMTLLSDESEIALSFMDGYKSYTKHGGLFIKTLAKEWSNIWDFLRGKSLFKDDYFKLIIENAELEDLKRIANKSPLVEDIREHDSFLSISKNEEKLKKIIETFKIKFTSLALEDVPKTLVDFVFENNYYQINESNIQTWLKAKGNFVEEEFYQQNYSSFNRQGKTLRPLIDYVDTNLSHYLSTVWLNLGSAQSEDPEYLSFIINSSNLAAELKREILLKNTTKLADIMEFDELDIKQLVLDMGAIEVKWHNLMNYFAAAEDVFDEHLVNFINHEDNAKALSEERLEYDKEDEEQRVLADKFAKALVLCDDIDDSFYAGLINRMPWWYGNLDFTALSEDKVKMLISILTVTKANYNRMRENFKNLLINLLERDPKKVHDNPDDFEMDEEDIAKILVSPKFSIKQKSTIVHRLNEETIIANRNLINRIGVLAAISDEMETSKPMVTAALKSEMPTPDKVILYNKKKSLYNKAEFFELIEFFGKPFNEIKPNHKQLVIQDIPENWKFASNIHKLGFTYAPTTEDKGIRIRNLKKEKA